MSHYLESCSKCSKWANWYYKCACLSKLVCPVCLMKSNKCQFCGYTYSRYGETQGTYYKPQLKNNSSVNFGYRSRVIQNKHSNQQQSRNHEPRNDNFLSRNKAVEKPIPVTSMKPEHQFNQHPQQRVNEMANSTLLIKNQLSYSRSNRFNYTDTSSTLFKQSGFREQRKSNKVYVSGGNSRFEQKRQLEARLQKIRLESNYQENNYQKGVKQQQRASLARQTQIRMFYKQSERNENENRTNTYGQKLIVTQFQNQLNKDLSSTQSNHTKPNNPTKTSQTHHQFYQKTYPNQPPAKHLTEAQQMEIIKRDLYKNSGYIDINCNRIYRLYELSKAIDSMDKNSENVKLPQCQCTQKKQFLMGLLEDQCLVCTKSVKRLSYSKYELRNGFCVCNDCEVNVEKMLDNVKNYIKPLMYRCATCQMYPVKRGKNQMHEPESKGLEQPMLCRICFKSVQFNQNSFKRSHQVKLQNEQRRMQRQLQRQQRQQRQRQRYRQRQRKLLQQRQSQRQRQRKQDIQQKVNWRYNSQDRAATQQSTSQCGICQKSINYKGQLVEGMVICNQCKVRNQQFFKLSEFKAKKNTNTIKQKIIDQKVPRQNDQQRRIIAQSIIPNISNYNQYEQRNSESIHGERPINNISITDEIDFSANNLPIDKLSYRQANNFNQSSSTNSNNIIASEEPSGQTRVIQSSIQSSRQQQGQQKLSSTQYQFPQSNESKDQILKTSIQMKCHQCCGVIGRIDHLGISNENGLILCKHCMNRQQMAMKEQQQLSNSIMDKKQQVEDIGKKEICNEENQRNNEPKINEWTVKTGEKIETYRQSTKLEENSQVILQKQNNIIEQSPSNSEIIIESINSIDEQVVAERQLQTQSKQQSYEILKPQRDNSHLNECNEQKIIVIGQQLSLQINPHQLFPFQTNTSKIHSKEDDYIGDIDKSDQQQEVSQLEIKDLVNQIQGTKNNKRLDENVKLSVDKEHTQQKVENVKLQITLECPQGQFNNLGLVNCLQCQYMVEKDNAFCVASKEQPQNQEKDQLYMCLICYHNQYYQVKNAEEKARKSRITDNRSRYGAISMGKEKKMPAVRDQTVVRGSTVRKQDKVEEKKPSSRQYPDRLLQGSLNPVSVKNQSLKLKVEQEYGIGGTINFQGKKFLESKLKQTQPIRRDNLSDSQTKIQPTKIVKQNTIKKEVCLTCKRQAMELCFGKFCLDCFSKQR